MSAFDTEGHNAWSEDNQWKNGMNVKNNRITSSSSYDSNNNEHGVLNTGVQDTTTKISPLFNDLTLDSHDKGPNQTQDILFKPNGTKGPKTNIFENPSSDVLTQSVWGTTKINKPVSNDPLGATSNILSGDNDSKNTTAGESTEGNYNEELSEWIRATRKLYNPLSPNFVTIEEIPEREGLLFKHINYKLVHLIDILNTEQSEDKSVIRRYSDFAWLLDILLKRYPFRIIPELPPKKIGTSQNSDAVFLKRRLKGLYSFINLIMKHPILKDDDLVLTFLTVPTDLSIWRKQLNNKFDTADEFQNKKISKDFIKLWKPQISQHLNDTANCLDKMIEIWSKLNVLVQRYDRRLKQKVHENKIFNSLIDELEFQIPIMYPIDIDENNNNTVLDINNNLTIINKNILDLSKTNEDEISSISNDITSKFKTYIDILFALKNMFDRYKIMATNNIPQLQRHIQIEMEKLESMKGKPDSSGTEYDKLRLSIKKDQRSIVQQLNRSWLIRKCILSEFSIFQETQFLVSVAFKNWVKLNANFTELNMNIWERLATQITNMPTSNEN